MVPPVMARGSVWEQESRFSRTGINLIIAEVGAGVQETMAACTQVAAAGGTWTGDRPALVVWGAWCVTVAADSSSIIVSSSSIGKKEQGQRGVALETGLLAMKDGLSMASIVTGGTKVVVGERVRVRVVAEVSGTPQAAEETRQ